MTGLDLRDITLVAQDWGGPIGFGVLAEEPDRFARVVAANTILHTADPGLADRLTWAVHGVGESRVVLEESLVDYLLYTQRAPQLRPASSSARPRPSRRSDPTCWRRTTHRSREPPTAPVCGR